MRRAWEPRMRGVRRKGFLVVALLAVAAAFPLAASAAQKKHPHAHLGLVPLQKSELGPAGASLAIQYDSGAVPNAQSEVPGYGRLAGYRVDYGGPYQRRCRCHLDRDAGRAVPHSRRREEGPQLLEDRR